MSRQARQPGQGRRSRPTRKLPGICAREVPQRQAHYLGDRPGRLVSASLYDVSITQIHGHHANRTLESALHALVTVPECASNGV